MTGRNHSPAVTFWATVIVIIIITMIIIISIVNISVIICSFIISSILHLTSPPIFQWEWHGCTFVTSLLELSPSKTWQLDTFEGFFGG